MRLPAILLFVALAGLILPLFSTAGNAEYTVPIVWSNKKQYDPSEMSYLFGYGFKPSSPVTVTITRPDLVEDIVQTSTDEFGYFACQYLLDGIHGTFNVFATDGVNVATTNFDNWLSLDAWWKSQDSIYLYSKADGLSTYKQYYIKYFDPTGVEKRQSPTYTGVHSFTDNLTILPSFPNILGWWTVKLYENNKLKRTKMVCIDRIVWTTDSSYTNLKISFAQGETVYFKTIGLITSKYYCFKLEKPDGTKFYVGSWTTGVSQMTGSYVLPSDAPIGTWKVHVRQANDASGTCETHYVDCCFQVTTAPPPSKYYLTVKTDPTSIGTIPGQGWYNACTIVNITAPEFFPGPTGTRYRFDYWDVDGTPNATGVMEISIHMDANHTATAHYITQYYLNLTTSPVGVTTPAGIGWYDSGTNAPIFAPEFVGIDPDASRYRFDGWTTGDMSEIADPSATSTTVFMDKAKTVTAHYAVQYKVTFSHTGLDSSALGTVVTADGSPKTYSDLPYSFWVDSNTVITYSYNNIVSTSVSGKRFSLIDVSGPVSPITVTSAVTVTGNYKTQYYLVINSPYGTPTSAGWYDSGSTAYASLDIGVVDHGNGTRRIFVEWTGDASGTNYALSDAITVDGPKTAAADWKKQYFFTFQTSGLGTKTTNVYNGTTILGTATDATPFTSWFDENAAIQLDVDSPIYGSPTRYVFTEWTGDASGSSRPLSVTVSAPKDITANYKTQYEVTFTHTGLDSSSTGTVVTVNGSPKTYGDLPYSIWVDSGTVVTYSYSSTVSSSVTGKQFSLIDVTGPVSPITVTSPVTVTGNYKTQYYLTVNSPYGTPTGSGWYDDGSTAYAHLNTDTVDHGNGTRRIFVKWNGDASGTGYTQSNPITMDGPKTATAVWKTQYLLTVRTSGLGTETTNVYNGSTILGTATDATPFTGWFDQGGVIQLDIDSPIYGSPTSYTFTSWTGDALGTSRPVAVTMNTVKDVTANYTTQHEVIFTYSGLDSSATGTVVTVDSNPKTYADLPYSVWVDDGTVITYSYSNVSSTTTGKRFVLTSVTGSSSPITVTGPVTVTGNYKTQYEITFNYSGVGFPEYAGAVFNVDGTDYAALRVFWWDSGSTHTFAFKSPLVVTANVKQYVWTSTTGLSTSQSGLITVSTSGSVTGSYKTQYYLTVTSDHGTPTPASGWRDSGASVTASVGSPVDGSTGTRYVCTGWTGTGSVPSSGTSTSVTFTITQASSITWNWKTQYLLTVQTSPSGLSPQPTRNPVGGAGPTDGWWYDAATGVTLTAQTVTGYTFANWDVDGASQGSGVNPIIVNMNAPHTATANYAITAPPLSGTINPLSKTIFQSQSVTFTSSVSGGTSPYTYQWYLNGNPVSGATSSSWTFTPPSTGTYYVYLKVTDSMSSTVQSSTATIAVLASPPVGGYSISLERKVSISPMVAYFTIVALFGAVMSLRKRKRK